MSFGYIPAVSFLGLILLLLVGLMAMYYCLKKDLCPCSQNEPKKAGYEELELGEENEALDDEPPHPTKTPVIVTTSYNESDGKSSKGAVSAYGDVPNEPLLAKDFSDVGSIRSTGTAKGSTASATFMGKVFIECEFFPNVGRVEISITEAQSIPTKSKGGSSNARFHVVLLPDKKQRYKTKSLKTPSPKYQETFVFDRLMKQDLFRLAVRMRLYGQSGVSKEKFLGEVVLQLADLAHVQDGRLETWRDILRSPSPGSASP